jgi:signal transduction histidine kinase
VAVRVRPLMQHELKNGDDGSRVVVDTDKAAINVFQDENINSNNCRTYKFDQVFDNTSSQQDVYRGLGIENMAKKVVEGYHATIFAYGQTGSGKTFTMEGSVGNSQ